MCGIFGIWQRKDKTVDRCEVRRAVASLRHRGPDDEGYLLGNIRTGETVSCSGADTDKSLNLPSLEAQESRFFDLAFGFRRLAVLDLSPAGHQPMGSADGKQWLIFNGEIYNYLELRSQLAQLGHSFKTQTDTEVILAAYQQWGIQCLEHFRGMWAFALWDQGKDCLFLARDPFGIKPLYYTNSECNFAFASEIKAFFHLRNAKRQVNPQRLYEYLLYGLTDNGEDTFLKQIKQLPAAYYLKLSLKQFSKPHPIRYWRLETHPGIHLSFNEAAACLREQFLRTMQLHLRSDVPVGSALSGGIDSSSIVTAIRHIQGEEWKLHAFSFIANDPKINEEKWIDLIGNASKAVLHKIKFQASDLPRDLHSLIGAQGEPFGSTSLYAQYRIFSLAASAGIKVMLDGQGADELLGGYRSYFAGKLASLIRRHKWSELILFLSHLAALSDVKLFSVIYHTLPMMNSRLLKIFQMLLWRKLRPTWLNTDWFQKRDAHHPVSRQWLSPQVLREQLSVTLTETSLPALLRYEDRNSMAFSIESRVPFLTTELANFILKLPENFIITSTATSKAVFKEAMRGLVPDSILNRMDKVGFATPERNWLMSLRPWAETVLFGKISRDVPVLNQKAVRREWDLFLVGRKLNNALLWRCINLYLWAEQFNIVFEN